MSIAPPPSGSMYLYDDVTPPLVDNSYRMDVVTNVSYDGQQAPLSSASGYFNIEGPRFTLPATDVAAVYPPRNGHGGFDENIPQIVIARRTLPWERRLTSKPSLIGTPKRDGDTTEPNPFPPVQGQHQECGPAPWMALLLLEESEYVLHQNVPLSTVLSPDIYARLNVDDGITCDSIEVEESLLESLLPSLDELTLLAHVRQVNVDDKELKAASSDGFYAVVMSNRLPSPGAKYRACLVSLEERTDLVKPDPPAVAPPYFIVILADAVGRVALLEQPPAADARASDGELMQLNQGATSVLMTVADRNVLTGIDYVAPPDYQIFIQTKQVVLLHSWRFECTGAGTFRDYMQRVNVSTLGTVEQPGHPPVIDTGHIPISVMDRAGVREDVWYRGPLVPMPLTRDPLTYHSADQCRRVTPETGAEDVTYAAAFECGRLMAAADPRLAQELMRWRRESYRQSVRVDSVAAIQTSIRLDRQLDIHQPISSVVAYNAASSIVGAVPHVGDRYGIAAVSGAPGLDPARLQQAWNLNSVAEAVAVLGGEPGATGVVINTPAQSIRDATTIDQVAADTASLNYLGSARDRILNSVQLKSGV